MSTASNGRGFAFAEHAYKLSELGWPLIPLKGKRAFQKDWPNTAPRKPDAAAARWDRWGEQGLNMGVVLGGAKLAVSEYDEVAARGRFFALLGGDFPPTPIC